MDKLGSWQNRGNSGESQEEPRMDGESQQAEAVLPAQDAGPWTDPPPRPHPERDPGQEPRAGGRPGAGVGTAPGRFAGGWLDPWLLAGAFFAVYTALSVTRYRRMLTMSWDLGIFEQAVKSYAHLRAPVADLKGPGFNILGDHFSPITALIAPFYRVFPTSVTLLVAQALLFAVSVVPVTRAAGRVFGRGGGAAAGVAYGLSWGVQRAVDFDFHEVAFAMPMLAFSLEAVLRKRWAAAMWWAVPLVLVKEDMGAGVAMTGLVVWLRTGREEKARENGEENGGAPAGGRGDVRTFALGLMGFGVAASAWEVNWFIPAFHGPGYDALNHLNGDGSLAGHIPVVTAAHTLLWVLLPTSGLLALRSPLVLVALPTVGWRFMSHYPENWGTGWHYSAVLMPVVFLAMVDAAQRLRAGRRRWLRAYAGGVPVAMAGAAVALSTQLPVAELAHPGTYEVSGRVRAVERMLDRIPDGATVEADIGPLSRLVRRTTVYWTGGTKGEVVPQYMALENDGWLKDPSAYARELHPGARYGVLVKGDGYVILRRE